MPGFGMCPARKVGALHLPSHDRWLAAGALVVSSGVVLAAVQLTNMQTDKRVGFFSALGIASLILIMVGALILAVGFFMKDKEEPPESGTSSGESAKGGQRIGYRVRGSGQVRSRNARIRNQDVAIDVNDDGRMDDEGTEIE